MDFRRSNELTYDKPPIEMFLGEYNALLASILVENIDTFAYIASPVINRMEAQTHFYEKIEKYIQIRDLLIKDTSIGIIVEDDDMLIYNKLKKEFNSRITKDKRGSEKHLSTIKKRLKRISILLCFIRMVIVFSRELRLIIASRTMRLPPMKYGAIIRTYFDFRCKTIDGNLREEYFGPFAVDLAEEEKMLVVYKLLHIKDLGTFFELHKKQSDFDSCLLEHFLTPGMLIRALSRFMRNKIRLKNKYTYRNHDITSLLQQTIDEEYYSLHGIDVFLEYEMAKRVLDLKAQRLYFPYENQTWEKVYPLAKKEKGCDATKIIGFQHTSLSYKLLMHFPAAKEKELPLFPDKIVTVGGIYQRLLKEKAHYPCEIVEGAALRHSKYMKNGSFDIKVPHKELQKRIVYAFSYDRVKYGHILRVLIDVFKNSGITVYLKIHPDYDENEVLRSLQTELPQNIVLAQKIPWNAVYDSVDCVVYDDNSIGVEGMMNGVKTYMLNSGEPIYECGRMFYFSEWETTINREGLEKLRDEICGNRFNPWFDMGKIRQYLDSYYNAYSKEKYFNAYL